MNANQGRKDSAGKWYTKYVLIVLATMVAATAFTLAVIWYPVDQAEVSQAVDAMMAAAPAAPQIAETDASELPPETERDDAPTRDIAGLEAEEAAEASVEWATDAGKRLIDDIVVVAKDRDVSDSFIRGALQRYIASACAARGGCTEKERDALELSVDNALTAHITDATDDVMGNAEWVGRLMLAAGKDDDALGVFVAANHTGHVRTLLVDAMSRGGAYDDENGLAFLMVSLRNGSGLTDRIVFGWAPKLRQLMGKMTAAEAGDVRLALDRYITDLRNQLDQMDPNQAAMTTTLIAELEEIERGE